MALNFKNKMAYKKWLAYGHMHVPGFGKTPQKVTIAGKPHKVKHKLVATITRMKTKS